MKEKLLKLYPWAKKNIQNIAIGILVLVIAVSFLDPKLEKTKGLFNGALESIKNIEILKEEPVKEVVSQKKIESIASCEPVVLSNDDISEQINLFLAPLSTYTVKKTGYFNSSITGEKMYMVSRELLPRTKGSIQAYLSIAEPVDNLKYNKHVKPLEEGN